MKIVTIAARVRVLLGLVFVFFDSNAFFNFVRMPPLPPSSGGQFLTALTASHYLMLVGGAQALGGLLLLINRFVPLGLAILGPVIVNILAFYLLMSREGISIASLVAILWLFRFYAYREYFATLFVQRAQPR
jgi:putative oxidoreductase